MTRARRPPEASRQEQSDRLSPREALLARADASGFSTMLPVVGSGRAQEAEHGDQPPGADASAGPVPSRIRVALVGPYPLDPSHVHGGVESSFVNLLQGLSQRDDVEPHVVSLRAELDESRTSSAGGVPVHWLPSSRRFTNLTRHRADRRRLRGLLAALRPDVVHAQDAHLHGYLCLRESRSPVVVSVHGIVREELRHVRDLRARVRASVFAVAQERYCVTHARYLLQPTRYPETYFGASVRGTFVDVGNAISDRFFETERRPVNGRIVYSGAVMPRKRLHDLVDALAVVRSSVGTAHLHVAGNTGDRRYVDEVRERVRAHRLEDAVTFLGALSHDELCHEYSEAAVLALPSGQETSPMAIGECMAIGVPVVATTVGGVPYLVQDGRTGYLTRPGDVPTIAERIADVLGDDDTAARLGHEARRRAERQFRASAVADRVVTVYRRALGDEPKH